MIDGIGDMDGCQCTETLVGAGHGAVMQGNGRHQRPRQSPSGQQAGGDIGVGGSEDGKLSLQCADLVGAHQPENLAKQDGVIGCERQFANIVQKACREGFFADRAFGLLCLANELGVFAGPDGVLPELFY